MANENIATEGSKNAGLFALLLFLCAALSLSPVVMHLLVGEQRLMERTFSWIRAAESEYRPEVAKAIFIAGVEQGVISPQTYIGLGGRIEWAYDASEVGGRLPVGEPGMYYMDMPGQRSVWSKGAALSWWLQSAPGLVAASFAALIAFWLSTYFALIYIRQRQHAERAMDPARSFVNKLNKAKNQLDTPSSRYGKLILDSRDFRVIYASREFCKMVGHDREALIDRLILEIMPSNQLNGLDSQSFLNKILRRLTSDELSVIPLRAIFTGGQSQKRFLSSRVSLFQEAGDRFILFSSTDVTDSLTSEVTNAAYRNAITSSPVAFIGFDVSGEIQWKNPAAAVYLDIDAESPHNVLRFFDRGNTGLYQYRILPEANRLGSWSGLLPFHDSKGEKHVVEHTIIPVRGSAGSLEGYTSFSSKTSLSQSAGGHDDLPLSIPTMEIRTSNDVIAECCEAAAVAVGMDDLSGRKFTSMFDLEAVDVGDFYEELLSGGEGNVISKLTHQKWSLRLLRRTHDGLVVGFFKPMSEFNSAATG